MEKEYLLYKTILRKVSSKIVLWPLEAFKAEFDIQKCDLFAVPENHNSKVK